MSKRPPTTPPEGSAGGQFSAISAEVGARLAERRLDLDSSLREVAEQAEISVSHLNDIERGLTQASLPVLLRVVRALGLTITELLPRIGGHHVASGSLDSIAVGSSATVSHDDLELSLEVVRLRAGESRDVDNPTLGDLLIYVLRGEATLELENRPIIELGEGDTMDSERLQWCRVVAGADADILIVTPLEPGHVR